MNERSHNYTCHASSLCSLPFLCLIYTPPYPLATQEHPQTRIRQYNNNNKSSYEICLVKSTCEVSSLVCSFKGSITDSGSSTETGSSVYTIFINSPIAR